MKHWILALIIIASCACNNTETTETPYVYGHRFNSKGADIHAPKLTKTYTKFGFSPSHFELIQVPKPSKTRLKKILDSQFELIQNRNQKEPNLTINGRAITLELLHETAQLLEKWVESDSLNFFDLFDLYKLKGKDKRGGMQFTGYYTPIFPVHHARDTAYQYPLFKLTNAASDSSNAKQLSIEKLWARKHHTAASIRLQGSGYIQYPSGARDLLSYEATLLNKAKNLTTDTALTQNAFVSYSGKPSGAGLVDLMAGHSIAVDTRYLPLGGCMIGAVPILDKRGRFTHHEFRFLFAQDTGGYIKGMHLDLYFGIGDKSLEKARLMKHYGRVWLLLPKEKVE